MSHILSRMGIIAILLLQSGCLYLGMNSKKPNLLQGEGPSPQQDPAPLSMSPSSASLSINETLQFHASGGQGSYQFSILSGGGSVSPQGLFSAPATNSNSILQVRDDSGSTIQVPIQVRIPPGTLDQSFANAGKLVLNHNFSQELGFRVHEDAQERILIASRLYQQGNWSLGLTRINSNGDLDPTFGANGKLIHPLGNYAPCEVLQRGNRIVVISASYVEFKIETFNEYGIKIFNFGNGGDVVGPLVGEHCHAFYGISGGIFVGGYSAGSGQFRIHRYFSDGSKDVEFGNMGEVRIQFHPNDFTSRGMIQDPITGNLYLLGDIPGNGNRRTFVARLEWDSLDNSFGQGGFIEIPSNKSLGAVQQMIWDPVTQKPITLGIGINSYPQYKVVLGRLSNSSSGLDLSFGNGGTIEHRFGFSAAYTHRIARSSDGKLWVLFSTSNALGFGLAKLHANGQIDNSFGQAGRVIHNFQSGVEDNPDDLLVLASGKILLSGTRVSGPVSRSSVLMKTWP